MEHYKQVGFIPEKQVWYNNRKSTNVNCHIKKLKKEAI